MQSTRANNKGFTVIIRQCSTTSSSRTLETTTELHNSRQGRQGAGVPPFSLGMRPRRLCSSSSSSSSSSSTWNTQSPAFVVDHEPHVGIKEATEWLKVTQRLEITPNVHHYHTEKVAIVHRALARMVDSVLQDLDDLIALRDNCDGLVQQSNNPDNVTSTQHQSRPETTVEFTWHLLVSLVCEDYRLRMMDLPLTSLPLSKHQAILSKAGHIRTIHSSQDNKILVVVVDDAKTMARYIIQTHGKEALASILMPVILNDWIGQAPDKSTRMTESSESSPLQGLILAVEMVQWCTELQIRFDEDWACHVATTLRDRLVNTTKIPGASECAKLVRLLDPPIKHANGP